MADEGLDFVPRQLAGEQQRVPVLFIEVVTRHDGYVFFAQGFGQLRVALQAQVHRLFALGYQGEHLIAGFVDSHALAKRVAQLSVWHAEYILFYHFMVYHQRLLYQKCIRSCFVTFDKDSTMQGS